MFGIKRSGRWVINEATRAVKTFETGDAAESYATLSKFTHYTVELV